MLYKTTVSTATLELLKTLMQDDELKRFVLVGGTSLALQIGHRISVDLDLFSREPFEENNISAYLTEKYNFELDFISHNTIKGEIDRVKIDCIAHQYPWVKECLKEENIRLASISDIAAMKLNAIAGNGSRIKDFIDIAYLSHMLSFRDMLHSYELKYNANPIMPLKAIVYWDDINFAEPVKMLASTYTWKKIERRLLDMQKQPDKIFPGI